MVSDRNGCASSTPARPRGAMADAVVIANLDRLDRHLLGDWQSHRGGRQCQQAKQRRSGKSEFVGGFQGPVQIQCGSGVRFNSWIGRRKAQVIAVTFSTFWATPFKCLIHNGLAQENGPWPRGGCKTIRPGRQPGTKALTRPSWLTWPLRPRKINCLHLGQQARIQRRVGDGARTVVHATLRVTLHATLHATHQPADQRQRRGYKVHRRCRCRPCQRRDKPDRPAPALTNAGRIAGAKVLLVAFWTGAVRHQSPPPPPPPP